MPPVPAEHVPGFDELGFVAFTTTREAGTFSFGAAEPAANVYARWTNLREQLAPHTDRLASSHQVHGTRIVEHVPGWSGWLRTFDADGHVTFDVQTAMVVSLADCVPVFLVHPSGAGGILHAGWRGTAARIIDHGVSLFSARGLKATDITMHLGPSICGDCYEVGPDVYAEITGSATESARTVDLREVLADHARAAGISRVSISEWCTMCGDGRFYSHRAGDAGRQLGVLVAGRH